MTDKAANYIIPLFCIFILVHVQDKELYVLKTKYIFSMTHEMFMKAYHVFGHKENLQLIPKSRNMSSQILRLW